MKVKSVSLSNFRNYASEKIEAGPGVNAFVGRNAQGKTNILEAIYYSALARSHRTSDDNDLIRWNEESSRLSVDFFRLGVENSLEFRFDRKMKRTRTILLNSHPIRVKDLVGSFNAVLFSPEDLLLVKGAPQLRRRFLDMEISQSSRAYFRELAMYTRAMAQRNSLLRRIKEGSSDRSGLSLWNEQLSALATGVVEKRKRAVKRLSEIARSIELEITGGEEELSIRYDIGGKKADTVTEGTVSWYNQMLRSMEDSDIARGSTGVGPHRDDISFFVNGADLRSYGSQGQQRTGALAVKLAELEFFREETGEYPVMLLDDVMSELDGGRREKLISFIRERDIQTFITATDEAYFGAKGEGSFFRVADGRIIYGPDR